MADDDERLITEYRKAHHAWIKAFEALMEVDKPFRRRPPEVTAYLSATADVFETAVKMARFVVAGSAN
jgi:hypothetical protein